MSIRIYFLTVRQIMRRIGEVRNWVESYYNLCHGEAPQYRNHSRALTREHFRDIYLLFQSISNATLLYISATCTTGRCSEAYTHISFNLNIVRSVAQDPHCLFLVTIFDQRYKRQRQYTEQNMWEEHGLFTKHVKLWFAHAPYRSWIMCRNVQSDLHIKFSSITLPVTLNEFRHSCYDIY